MAHTDNCKAATTRDLRDCDCGENSRLDKCDQSSSFFICPHCASLVTSEEINEEVKSGGTGLCDCEYMKLEWDEDHQTFEPIYYRIYHDRIEIDRDFYNILKEESNSIKKLEMFDSVLR